MKLNEAKVEVKNLKMQIDTMEKFVSRLVEILKVKDEISKKVQRQLKEKEREMEEIVAQKEEEIGELNRNVKSKEEDVNEMWRIVIEKEEINYDLSLKLVAKEDEMLILKEILIEKELAVQNRQIDHNKSEIRYLVNPTEDQIVLVGSETKDDVTQMNKDEIAVTNGKTEQRRDTQGEKVTLVIMDEYNEGKTECATKEIEKSTHKDEKGENNSLMLEEKQNENRCSGFTEKTDVGSTGHCFDLRDKGYDHSTGNVSRDRACTELRRDIELDKMRTGLSRNQTMTDKDSQDRFMIRSSHRGRKTSRVACSWGLIIWMILGILEKTLMHVGKEGCFAELVRETKWKLRGQEEFKSSDRGDRSDDRGAMVVDTDKLRYNIPVPLRLVGS